MLIAWGFISLCFVVVVFLKKQNELWKKPATILNRRAEDRSKQRKNNTGNRNQVIMTDASCEVMKPTYVQILEEKNKFHIVLLLCNCVCYDIETIFPSISFLNMRVILLKKKIINCASILWANNNTLKQNKQNQTKTQKPRFTKQYSYQHLIKQLLIVHLRLCSALEILTETTWTEK